MLGISPSEPIDLRTASPPTYLHNNDVGLFFAGEHAPAHNDEFMCSGMVTKQRQGRYSRSRSSWTDGGELIWVKKRRRGVVRGRDCGPA